MEAKENEYQYKVTEQTYLITKMMFQLILNPSLEPYSLFYVCWEKHGQVVFSVKSMWNDVGCNFLVLALVVNFPVSSLAL